jgi:hypothetical protein
MNNKTAESQALKEVLYILLITLLAFSLYSYSSLEFDFSVKLKKSGIKSFLSEPESQPIFQKIKAQILKNPLDTTSQTILLTGDSMCEGLMFRFKQYADKNKHQLKTVIWYGSTTIKWSESDSLRKLIEKYKPSYVFFTTGSNELFIRDIQEREKHIQDIVNQMNQVPFIWIGPPNWTNDTGINDLIIKNVGRDRFFESRNLKFDRGPDGAHPTWTSSAVWADTISAWVMQKSRHKIRLKNPQATKNF